jgi:prophage regulatory protein
VNQGIIRKPEVKRRTGLSGTMIWRYEKAGVFPARVQLNPASTDKTAPVGWFEDEIDSWVRSRVRVAGTPEKEEAPARTAPHENPLAPPGSGHQTGARGRGRAEVTNAAKLRPERVPGRPRPLVWIAKLTQLPIVRMTPRPERTSDVKRNDLPARGPFTPRRER